MQGLGVVRQTQIIFPSETFIFLFHPIYLYDNLMFILLKCQILRNCSTELNKIFCFLLYEDGQIHLSSVQFTQSQVCSNLHILSIIFLAKSACC